MKYNSDFTKETAVVIIFSKELLILSYYLQQYKENYNREIIGLEFRCFDPKHLKINVSSVIIVVKWNKSILDNSKAIQIGLLLMFSNTNLRKVLPKAYPKYLLLFNLSEVENHPIHKNFEHKIKLIPGPKEERLYNLSTKELKVFKQ